MDLHDTHSAELWNRFRTVAKSVSDVKTLRDLAQKRAHRAQSNAEKLRQQSSGEAGPYDAPEMRPEEWQRRYERENKKTEVLQAMLNYFIAHHNPQMPPPSLEEMTRDEREAVFETYELIGEPKKTREIYEAIRRVLHKEDVPSGKIKFYKAADRERGLSGEGRATENWVRDNERDPLPGPDYWREKFSN